MHRKGQATNAVLLGTSSILVALGFVVFIKAYVDSLFQSPLFAIEILIGSVLLVLGVAGIFLGSR